MMNPLPTMVQSFSIMDQEEKQREVKPHILMNLGSTSLSASSGSNNFKMNFSHNRHTNAYKSSSSHSQNSNRRVLILLQMLTRQTYSVMIAKRVGTQRTSAIDYMASLKTSSSLEGGIQDQQQMFIAIVKN